MKDDHAPISLGRYETMRNEIDSLRKQVGELEKLCNLLVKQEVYVSKESFFGSVKSILNPEPNILRIISERDDLQDKLRILQSKKLPFISFNKRVSDL